MDFQSAMETFAEAWVAANAGQQSQALALTRAANAAAAAAAAANAAAATSSKSPSANLADIAVKKEHSLSPPHIVSVNASAPGSSSAAAAAAALLVGGADGNLTPPHARRPSLQGVQDKLSQMQMQQSQQQHLQHQQQQHQQQQQQQQTQHHQQQQLQASNEEARSPRYATAVVGGVGGGRCSTDTTASPTPNVDNLSAALASSQNPALSSATPKLSGERDVSVVGSITCLPPSALNAVGAAAAAAAVGNMGMCGPAQSQTEKLLPAPSTLMENSRRDFDMSKVNSKSLPLHCVVESVHSLQASLTIDTRNPWKRRPNIETDSYVIVAAATPWSEIVQTALQRLGYSQETANTARGSLIIKNWKPIPLEQISDNPVVPVCDIIGELTSVVTLRIVILRTKPSPFGEIKDKLLKLLVLQSHAVLRSTGCPLDEVTLSQICRSTYQNTFAFPGGEITEEVRRKFDQWWSNQLSPQPTMTPKMLPFMSAPPAVPNEMDFPVGTAAVAAAAAAAAAAQAGLHAAATGAANVPVGGKLPNMGVAAGISASRESLLMNDGSHHQTAAGSAAAGAAHHGGMMVHPPMHPTMHHLHHHAHAAQYPPNQKTRMRTSFDPEMELPKLQKWFQENPHPSRQQIQTYVVQLNTLESRRGRKPLDVNNVVYWFKNARAAQKRAEMRGNLGALGHAAMNGFLSQHGPLGGPNSAGSSVGSLSGSGQQMGGGGGGSALGNLSISHDFLKSPLSLKSEDIDTMSQHSDDMDEDQSRPGSPQLPLSLTTHERNRNSPGEDEEERSDSRRGSSLKDEGDCRDLLNGSLNQSERSRSRSYNEHDAADKQEKDHDANIIDVHQNDNSNERAMSHSQQQQHQLQQHQQQQQQQQQQSHHDTEANNNLCTSNNNNSNNSTEPNDPSTRELQPPQSSTLSPKRSSPKQEDDEDLDMDEDDEDNENDTSQLDDFRSPSPDMSQLGAVGMSERKDLPFPMVPNSMFSQSFMYMSHYMPGFSQAAAAGHPHAHHAAAAAAAAAGMQSGPLMGGLNLSGLSNEERRKRNRTFIDPVTEVPKLEQWFAMNTHPSHNLILKYTEDLNTMPYRQKFPRLESKNVQFWFKNRRAKCKRLKMSLYDNSQCSQLSGLNSFVHKYEERD